MPRLGFLVLLAAVFVVWKANAQRDRCRSSTDFIFVLDSSGSLVDQPLRTSNWGNITEFLEIAVLNIADTIERNYTGASAGLRFGLVQFRDIGVITFGLNDFRDYRRAAEIMGLATNLGGQTNMAAGLEEVEKMLGPPRANNVRKTVIIVVSDWSPFNDTVRTNSVLAARRLERMYDASIITVGVLGSVERDFLMDVSTGGRNVMSEDHATLIEHVSSLIQVVCETPGGGTGGPGVPGPGGPCERDVVFAIDASYSLSRQQDFMRLKTFVSQVAGNIFQTARDTRMGVVVFSTTANVTIPLQLYTQNFARQVEAISFDPRFTNPADALRKAREMLQGSNRSKFVIIFTDGLTNEEQGEEAIIAEEMRNDDGIVIIAFGVSDKIDFATLEKLVGSDKTGSNIFWSPDYQTNMISKLNTLTLTAEGCPARDIPCDIRPQEVIVALDASGSIKDKGPNNWQRMQDFGAAVVQSIHRTYPNSRVGALIFSDFASEIIPLTAPENTRGTQRIIAAIRNAEHVNGYTNEADALRVAMRMLQGARNPSYRYVVMVTDGQPTQEIGQEIDEADTLESNGITRIMIGVTSDIKEERLKRLGSSPSDRYVIFTKDFNTLNAVGLITSVVTAASQCDQTQQARPVATSPPRQCFGADVILVMDSSGSIEEKGKGNFELLKTFTATLASNIANRYPQTKFGLVLFSDVGRVVSSLRDYRSILGFIDVIGQQRYNGSQTNIASALRVARQDVVQYGQNNRQIIIITDGTPTAEVDQTVREAELARRADIQISAVGITYDIAEETLGGITGSSSRVFMTPKFTDLQNEIVKVTEVACEPGSAARAGAPCSGDLEVVFSLDASGSIKDLSPTAWEDAKNLVKSAINAFYNFNRNTRFGLVIFSDFGRREFGLSGDVNDLPRLVDAAFYNDGRTNIADGIEIARRDVFSASRPGANQILILITDGEPNERVNDTDREAGIAKRDGITIVSVGITEDGPDYALLTRVASSPSQVIRSLSFSSLSSQINNLVSTSCQGALTTRPNPNVVGGGFGGFTTKPGRFFPFRPAGTTPRILNRVPGGIVTTPIRPQRPAFTAPPRGPGRTLGIYPTTALPRPPIINNVGPTPISLVFDIPSVPCIGGYVILVLDVSQRLNYKTFPSNGTRGLLAMAANIITVMSQMKRDAKFAIVTYNATAKVQRDFGIYRPGELESFLQNLNPAQSYDSNIADGFAKAQEVLQRSRASRSLVVLVTDGEATLDSGIEQTRADQLRTFGSKVVVIAVSKNFNENKLRAITRNDPSHLVAQSYNFDPNLLEPYYQGCSRNPNSVAALRDDNTEVCPEEVVFLIDSSGSISDSQWEQMKFFLITLVDKFSEKLDGVKFGTVMFGNSAQLGFYLSDDLYDVKTRLQNLRQLRGQTNMARGLSVTRRYMFSDNDAKKLVLLVAEGNPTSRLSETYQEADKLREDVELKIVGLTDVPAKTMLDRIAGSEDKVVRINGFSDLLNSVDTVRDLGCKAGQPEQQP